jgi:hypothetical protein
MINQEDFEGLTVGDIFDISFDGENKKGASFKIGFTELGNKAINDLMKRNPKITEKDVEEYIRKVSINLLVLYSQKIKENAGTGS